MKSTTKVGLIILAFAFAVLVLLTYIVVPKIKEVSTAIEEQKLTLQGVYLSEWFISQYTEHPLDYPKAELPDVSLEVEQKIKSRIEEEKKITHFNLTQYVAYLKENSTTTVDSYPDDSVEVDLSQIDPANIGVVDVDEEELRALEASLDQLPEARENDRRIIKIGEEDMIPLESLDFSKGMDIVTYDNNMYTLAREIVPYTFEEKLKSPSYRYEIANKAYGNNTLGIVLTSLDSKNVLRLQFDIKKGQLATVDILEMVGN